MKKLKTLMVALGAVAMTGSAFAIPTLIISDGVTSTSLTSASGIVTYANATFDNAWSVVISTGETKPVLGSAVSPTFDLNVQATSLSLSPVRNLTISFSDNGFGPSPSSFQAQLSGHLVSGVGQNVLYNTYVDAGNVTSATTTLLTTSGSLTPPTYASLVGGTAGSLALYSITQVLTINGTPTGTAGGSYSLDGSLTGVPDGGTTVMLLGAALSGLALLRRKMA
jgi:hypothetical protein